MVDLTKRENHFEFGKNWADYSESLDESRISSAVAGLQRLCPDLEGRSFFDIGCGSGVHSLAALKLGASCVTAVDIDENSVGTTRKTLAKYAPDAQWNVSQASVFDLDPAVHGVHDVVYSWGVLHHTGDMFRALDKSIELVKPGGTIVMALYTESPRRQTWTKIKRFYCKTSGPVQWLIRLTYMTAFLAYLPATGFRPWQFVRDYRSKRGMKFSNDVHDWLGGYPYDSISVRDATSFFEERGLKKKEVFALDPGTGFWSEGCSEYVYQKPEQGMSADVRRA